MTVLHQLPPMVGQSPEFLFSLDRVSAVAPLDRSVLIIGERGTGKELLAARMHFLSPRWSEEYVAVNCAALSESLLESELFGHEAGAFTGATQRHVGRFEMAHGGSLFLDEIASASQRIQEKILRVVEYGEFERVGGTETIKVDVRLIGATNVDLPEEVRQGRFRADLLDRLAFDVVTLPPLRVRWEDIPVLAQHFATNMTREMQGDQFAGFGMDAMRVLMKHDWPGNVRELKNVVERNLYHWAREQGWETPVNQIVLDPFDSPWRPRSSQPTLAATGSIQTKEAPQSLPAPQDDVPFRRQVSRFERILLRRALRRHGGHQGNTAKALGLSYDQLRHYLKKHDIRARAPE